MSSTVTIDTKASTSDGIQQSGTMKAAVISEFNKPLQVRDNVPIPTPGVDQLLVKVTASSLCMSDIFGWAGHAGATPPFTPGHEPVGVVAQVGSGVRGFSVGDRVGFMTAAKTCQECSDCIGGNHRFCETRANIGFDGKDGLYGGFSTYCIADPLSTAKLPSSLSDEAAAPLLCAGVTAYGALKKVSLTQPSGTVLNIIGSGGVGHLAIMYAKAMGYIVHAFDIADDKIKLAKDSGADQAFNSLTTKPEEVVKTRNTIVVSGAAPAYAMGFKITQNHGTVVAIGVPHADISVSVLDMILRDLSLVATNVGTKQELVEALQLAADHGIKPVYELRQLDQLQEGFEAMMKGEVAGRLVYQMS